MRCRDQPGSPNAREGLRQGGLWGAAGPRRSPDGGTPLLAEHSQGKERRDGTTCLRQREGHVRTRGAGRRSKPGSPSRTGRGSCCLSRPRGGVVSPGCTHSAWHRPGAASGPEAPAELSPREGTQANTGPQRKHAEPEDRPARCGRTATRLGAACMWPRGPRSPSLLRGHGPPTARRPSIPPCSQTATLSVLLFQSQIPAERSWVRLKP